MAERLTFPTQEPFTLPPIIEPHILYEAPIGDPPVNLEKVEFALTQKQREWVLKRDGHKCQATCRHNCNQRQGLEVDHLMPQRYAFDLGIDPDFPENTLSKCKNAHNIKHPDRIATLHNYHDLKSQGRNAFQELGQQRDELLQQHKIYWNDANDRTDSVRAVQLTQRFKPNNPWPEKKSNGQTH
jgi:hypothetical protein